MVVGQGSALVKCVSDVSCDSDRSSVQKACPAIFSDTNYDSECNPPALL